MGALILSIAEQDVLKASPSVITALNNLFAAMANFYFSWQITQKNPIVDGQFLMNYFHLSPGPLIGDLLDFLKESQAEGKVTHKDELSKKYSEIKNKKALRFFEALFYFSIYLLSV